MKNYFAFLLIAFIQISCLFATSSIETYQINLDLEPEERWKEVIIAKKEFIHEYAQLFLDEIEKYDLSIFFSTVEQSSFFKNTEFALEIEGVAKYSGFNSSIILLINYMYECFAACTSIVYEDEDGQLVLGHNLDYFFTVPMGHSIILLEFFSKGNLVYKAQSVAGQIGLFSAMKTDSFALTLNQRSNQSPGNVVSRILGLLQNQVYPVIYNIRLSLDESQSFKNLVQSLSVAHLGSPCYFIVCGINHNEGAIITRDPESVVDLSVLDADENDDDGWFLVQTNSDRNLTDYEERDIRRYTAENRIRYIGNGEINPENMINNVLGLYPNKNPITILSSFMQPQTGEFETVMWV